LTFSFSDFKKLLSEKHIHAKSSPGTGFGVGKILSVLESKSTLLLDNAKYHQAEPLRPFLTNHQEELALEFLPAKVLN
jgi:hypothetical protein